MQREKFEEDPWLYPRYELLFIINCNGKIIYEPNRFGDCTDANPFPRGYIPRIGERFSIQRINFTEGISGIAIDGYDNDNYVPLYEVTSLRMKIVETSQQRFQSICYLIVKQVVVM